MDMATAAKLKSAGAGKDDKDGKDTQQDGGGRKIKLKTLILIVVPLLLAAGVGGYLMLGSGDGGGEPKPVPGAVLPMDAVTINLSGGHYLKLKIALQGTVKASKELDGSKALDLAVDEFSYKSIEQLASPKARDKVKAGLVKHVVEVYEGEVMDVYFTEFVMQ
jgi:flagellar FliL protein